MGVRGLLFQHSSRRRRLTLGPDPDAAVQGRTDQVILRSHVSIDWQTRWPEEDVLLPAQGIGLLAYAQRFTGKAVASAGWHTPVTGDPPARRSCR